MHVGGDVRALLRSDQGAALVALLTPPAVDPREDDQAHAADEQDRRGKGLQRGRRARPADEDPDEADQDEADAHEDPPGAGRGGRAGRLASGPGGGRGPGRALVVVRLLPHQRGPDQRDDDRHDEPADRVEAQGRRQQRGTDDQRGEGQQSGEVGAPGVGAVAGRPRRIVRRQRQHRPERGVQHQPHAAGQGEDDEREAHQPHRQAQVPGEAAGDARHHPARRGSGRARGRRRQAHVPIIPARQGAAHQGGPLRFPGSGSGLDQG